MLANFYLIFRFKVRLGKTMLKKIKKKNYKFLKCFYIFIKIEKKKF